MREGTLSVFSFAWEYLMLGKKTPFLSGHVDDKEARDLCNFGEEPSYSLSFNELLLHCHVG